MPLTPLNDPHHLKSARVVRKSLASDFQFGQRAVIISITSIEMPRLCEVRFARIRLQTKRGIDRVLRHGQLRGSMVDPIEIKLIVSKGQLAIRIQKRWVARDSPVQQIDCLPIIRFKRFPKKDVIGARIKIESNEIAGRAALNGQFLSGCNFGMKLLGDFLRDLTLDCEQVIQIAVVLFDPDVGISPRVDQLRVQMKMRTGPADAALQNVRYPQLVTDLTEISFATVIHHAGPADDFEIGDLRQLGQNVVLNTVGKGWVLFLLAQVFKWQYGNSVR